MSSMLSQVDQVVVLESTLYNHQIRRKADGKVYNIEKVIVEKWTLDHHEGWWIKLLIERDQSHGLIYWQNINCTEPLVRETCDKARDNYELIPR